MGMNDRDIYERGITLWNRWTTMWNHEPELALDLVAPRFVLHLTLPRELDETAVDSPSAVHEWVVAHRAKFTRLRFTNECGPFVDVRTSVVAGPWIADAAIADVPRPVCGMDTIRFDDDGKIVEYWTMSTPVERFGRWAKSIAP
jgi:hypothetical protein